jgi:hypothetical protein
MNDHELDMLLENASQPKPKKDFMVGFFEQSKNVVTFPHRNKGSPWLVGLPLAASLIVGLWLGSSTNIASPTSNAIAMVDDATATNVDDLMSLIESEV